ncbi:solute carrier family 35 member G2-like [Branchiostoma floridae x Branchiostoma belcheri]
MTQSSDSDDSRKVDNLVEDQDQTSEDTELIMKDFGGRLWRKNHLGVAACLASGIFAGLVPATLRYVEDRGYTAYQLNFFSDLLLVSVVLCVAACHKTSLIPTSYSQFFRLVFQGVGRFLGILCQFAAYRYAPPAKADAVMDPTTIVFVAALSYLFLQEIPTSATMFGGLWCIAGVALVGYSGVTNRVPSAADSDDDVSVGTAVMLVIIAALLAAMLRVNIKGLLESGTTRTVILSYTYGIDIVLSGVLAICTSQTWFLEPAAAAVLFAGCVSRCSGVALMYAGLKLVEVNAATALLQINAFPAFGLQWAILGFAPAILDGFGLTFIFIGMFFVVIWETLVRHKKKYHGKPRKLELDELRQIMLTYIQD